MKSDTGFDPVGTDDGTPTATVTSSVTPDPKFPPDVKRILFEEEDNPSTAETE